MPSIFSSLYTLRKGMSAQQYAINTTSHNIANANTEGYSRQRVTMEASRPEGVSSFNTAFGPGQMGTGVDVAEVIRTRDEFLDTQIRNESSTLERFKAREQFLSEIETIFMEPSENGLSKAMGEMWNSWQKLSGGAENSNLRNGVIDSSKAVTDMMNHTYYQLNNLESNADVLAKAQVYDMNQIIGQIEDLNQQIMSVRISNNNPNDLLDKQDLLIDKLAGMVNITTKRGELGNVEIYTGSTKIVGPGKKSLSFVSSVTPDATGGKIDYYAKGDTNDFKQGVDLTPAQYNSLIGAKLVWTDESGNLEKVQLDDGSIKGFTSIYKEINEYKDQLNALAKGIAYAVNTIMNDGDVPYVEGTDPPVPTPGYIPLFVTSDGNDDGSITAENISINRNIANDLSLLKTNGKKSVSPTVYYPANNGDRALAVSQLRDSRLFINEFLNSSSSVISAQFKGSTNVVLANSPKNIIIKGNGTEAAITVSNGDSLQTIADNINANADIKAMNVKASVDDGRLIIQSMKTEDNLIEVSDDDSGSVLEALKIYGKDSLELRLNNSIVSHYDKTQLSMKISDDSKGTTLDNYFKDTIAKLGASARQATGMIDSQEALVSQLGVRKESVSGVSMDEEMVNLIQYQKAYEAAARMISTVDEMLDIIINRMVR